MIWFQFRYDLDGSADTPGFSSDGVDFHLGVDNADTPALAEFTGAVPAGKVFAGWSLTPNNTTGTGIYQPGQIIPRTVVMNNAGASVTYVSYRAGYAYINLYPVLVDDADSSYTDYTVFIHMGSATTTYSFNGGVVGSYLDRDFVLDLERVASLVDDNPTYILDGAASDDFVLLTRNVNEFHLYYISTDPVSITFVSDYGFTDSTSQGSYEEKTGQQSPGTVMQVPTPYEGDGVNATFIGWSILSSEDRISATSLTGALVPYEDTTYYAVYADDITLSFYTFNGTTWESAPTTISVPDGQSITDAGQANTVTGLEREINGYTFSHWAQNGPYGTRISDVLNMRDFSAGTTFYAVYTPQSNISITLNANGGTFTGNQGTVQLTNTTYGQRLSMQQGYQQPTRSGGYIFVGWSLDQDDTVGELDPTIAVSSGATYYAIWIAAALDVSVAAGEQVYDGTEKTPALTVTYNNQTITEGGADGYSVEWFNNTNAGVASVLVTYQGRQGFATFEIQPKDIADQSVSTSGVETQYDFTGSTLMPQPTVTDTAIPGTTSGVLALGTDYALSFGANTDVGGGTVAVRGVGNYQGTREIQFQIVAPDGDLTIVPIPDQTYTGSAIELTKGTTLLVYDSNRRLLQDDEYTVQYQNNQEIGQATVIVTGQGNYASKSATGRFQIVAQGGGRLNVVVNPVQMPVGDGVPDIEVTSTATTALGQNYQLSYDRYSEADGSWTPTDETMAEAGIYRVTATGTGAFTGTSGTATFVRTALSDENGLRVSLETSGTVLVYDGVDHSSLLDELVVVRPGGGGSDTTLNEGDFTYTVTHNGEEIATPTGNMVDAGVYTVRVTGDALGDYNGLSGSLTIYIRPRDISNATIAPQQAGGFTVTYTGQAHDHPYTVTDDGLASGATATTLQADRDYTEVAHNHEAHTGAGTYVVTINGTGNYTGSNSFEFTIEPVRIQVGGTWNGADMGNVQLEYGYTDTAESLADYLSQAEDQVLTVDGQRDDVEIHLYVDSNLQVGQNHPHLHGTLSGADMANYVLDIQSGVDVSAVDLSSAEEGDLVVTVAPTSHEWNGAAHTPTILVTYQNRMLTRNTDYEVSYLLVGESGNTDVTNTGGMVEVGNYIVRITGRGNYSGTAEGSFEVTPPRTGGNLVVAIDGADEYTYTGQDIQPQIVVTYGGEILEVGTEYEVIYSGNRDVGQATITVQGRGNTYGNMTGSTTFRINPKDISEAADTTDEITVAPLDGPFVFDGNAHTPVPEITYTPAGGSEITLNNRTDFHLSYEDNVQAGEATVTITGSGNYTGSREVHFTIEYAPVTLSFYTWTEEDGWVRSQTTLEATYGTALTEHLTTIEGLATEQSGYTFAGWAENSPVASPITSAKLAARNNFNAPTAFYAVYRPRTDVSITLNGNGGTVDAIGGQTAASTVNLTGQTYGTVLRPTATRENYTFAGWSTQTGATIGDLSITVDADGGTYYAVWLQTSLDVDVSYDVTGSGTFTYNGQVQRPTITVTASNGDPLDEGEYEVQYSGEGIDAGTYGFTVRANDGGALGYGTYTIAPKSIAVGTISVSGLTNVEYNGSLQQPLPTVLDTGVPDTRQTLVLNRDFTLAYSGNLNAGQATVTIGGIGNYTETVERNFTILPYTGTLTVAPIPSQELVPDGVTVDGLLVVYDSNGNVLTLGDDFDVEYVDNDRIGQATVNVTGTGANYTGASGAGYFQITPVGGGGASGGFTVTVTPQMSAVGEQDPNVSVTMGSDLLNITQDYTLTFEEYVNGNWTPRGSLTDLTTQLDNAGMYRITATGTGTYIGNSGSVIFVRTAANTSTGGGGDGTENRFVITGLEANDHLLTYTGANQRDVLNDLGISVDNEPIDDQYYTVTVSYNNGAEEPAESVDMTDAGIYTIHVQGSDNYAQSSATATIYIQPQDISNAQVTGVGGHTYGDVSPTVPTTQSITVTDNDMASGYQQLGSSAYTVAGLDAISETADAGSYLVTITGTGNFTGYLTATYTIAPKSISVTDPVNVTFGYTTVNLDALETQIRNQIVNSDTVDINLYVPVGLGVGEHPNAVRGYLSGADVANYQLTLNSPVNVGQATITPPGGGDGEDGDNVFRVYVYPARDGYTGEAHNPAVVVTHNGQMLVLNEDFEITGYQNAEGETVPNMTEVGQYTIQLEGVAERGYNGTFTAAYEITNVTGTGALTIAEIGDKTYTGSEITLTEDELVVRYNGRTLTLGEHYTVRYENNLGRGTATVYVEGMPNTSYANMSGSANFTINPKSIGNGTAVDDIDVTGVENSYNYNGSAIRPEPIVLDETRGEILRQNSDYGLSYGLNISGTGTVTITGIGNYTGTVVLTFTINRGDSWTISDINLTYVYTGEAIQPVPTVTDSNGLLLEQGVDYELSYGPNLNVGNGTVTVTGIGEYDGMEQTVTFQIVAELLHLDVTVNPDSLPYEDSTTEITVDVELDGMALTQGDGDYTLTYQVYDGDGNLSTAQPLTDPSTQLREPGMYVITAIGTGDYDGSLGTDTFVRLPARGTLDPVIPEPDPEDPDNDDISINAENGVITMTYNGQNRVSMLDGIVIQTEEGTRVTPTRITVSYNSGTAVELTDSYEMINAGSYTVTYTAAEGSANVIVVINPKNVNDDTISVVGLGANDYTYDGTQQSPTVSLTDSETQSITVDTDYTVDVGAQTNAGTYPVTIQGTGNYTGYRYESFIINQRPVTVTELTQPEYIYGYTGPIELVQDEHYSVSGILPADESTVTVSVTVPNGLSAGEHMLDAVLSDTVTDSGALRNYTVTGGVTVIINPIDITDPDGDGQPGVDEDGDGEPDPNPDKGDEDGDGVVDPDTDTDEDGNIEDVGGPDDEDTPDGIIETVSGFRVEMSPVSQPFNGQPHNPTITVTYQPDGQQATTLQRDTDYTVTYWNSDGEQVAEMVAVGEYTVRVTMTGNYQGGFDLTYTITPPDPTPGEGGEGGDGGDGDTDNDGSIEDGDGDHEITWGGFHVTMVPYSVIYNGQAHYPMVTVTYTPDGGAVTTLREQQDYTVGYYDSEGNPVQEMINVGTYTVRVTGVGNYDGFVFELDFTITQQSGGGGIITPPDPEGPDVADPDDTGVSE
ncbi:InlB B-repeat-containing protein, partial [uncultured Flavonifractor sp.]|uniref:InlB B-repeat-containing protein n=1 Tax=uncultured Flavonifractor sp. TaxID=1193534 RepID=UPI00260AFD95